MPSELLYPRPEYPRPDSQRGTREGYDWLNLNGPWQFRFDPDGRGTGESWFQAGSPEWREQIIVPFCWESLAAWGEGAAAGNDNYYSIRPFRNPLEVTRANHRSAARYEVGWYRREVCIPDTEPWRSKRVMLHVGAADFYTDCWCNGMHLGRHEGGYLPFEFDLTDALRPQGGRQRGEIVLRVEDPMDNAEQPVGKQWRWYTTTSGIWQTVYIEPRNAEHVRAFRIQPDLDAGTVRFEIQCEAGDDCRIEAEIQDPSGGMQTGAFKIRRGVAGDTLKLNQVLPWDPNNPQLYPVALKLVRGPERLDQVRTYFGIRKVDFEPAAENGTAASLRLNGVARYLRGALYQSYYPDGVYTATSVETLKNDILQAKRFGFNFLRVHLKIDDPLLLYWADKLGMLLMADFPNFGEGGDTPLGRERFETMMRGAIERDFNHPSIFAWCLFNETWGFGGQTGFLENLLNSVPAPPPKRSRTGSSVAAAETRREETKSKLPARGVKPGMVPPQEWVQSMWELAKHLDPTRPVEDMSVCHWDHLEYFQHCDTDINSWHFYIGDYDKAKAHIEKVVRSTFVGSTFNYVPGFKHRGQPLINSEYGGVGALDGDRDVSWSFKFLTNEMRRHQEISAYIYTELHDVEWEYNGFLNYDRTPKEFGYDPRLVNESNTLPIDAPPIQRVAPGQVVRLDVASSHFSMHRWENVALHWALGGVDSRGRLHQDLADGRVRIPFSHRRVAPAHTLELRMPGEIMLCTVFLTARNTEGAAVAENYVYLFVTPGYPPAREDTGRSLILRGLPGSWAAAEWAGDFSDRDRSHAEDACSGFEHGYFEWTLPLEPDDLRKAARLKVICEVSSHRVDCPQTDDDIFPTTLRITLNDFPLYHGTLRNHPHDARGALSYLRGGLGAYGYLIHAAAEGDMLERIASATRDGPLRLRFAVPAESVARGGLTLYGAECGRFPVCPTVVIDRR